jgi:hypothetical protein
VHGNSPTQDPHILITGSKGRFERVTVDWVLGLLMASTMLSCWMAITRPTRLLGNPLDDFWDVFGPAFALALLMLPISPFDVLRLSNKAIGPMNLTRNEMQSWRWGEAGSARRALRR